MVEDTTDYVKMLDDLEKKRAERMEDKDRIG
jgi:hypothetical protein